MKMKKNMSLVAIVGILFATGVTFSRAFVGQMKLGVPVALGDEEGGSGGGNDESKSTSKEKSVVKVDNNEGDNQSEEKTKKLVKGDGGVKKTQDGEGDNGSNVDEKDGDNADKNLSQGDGKQEVDGENGNANLSQGDGKQEADSNNNNTDVSQSDGKQEVDGENGNTNLSEGDGKQEAQGDNNDEGEQYKNDVAKVANTLEAVASKDGVIGQQVKIVAQEQKESAVKVENAVNDIKGRSSLAKFFVGPNYKGIAEVQAVIAENQNRIKVLTDVMNQTQDPAAKKVLQEQIALFTQQNSKLQNFTTESEKGASLFGWLAKMLS